MALVCAPKSALGHAQMWERNGDAGYDISVGWTEIAEGLAEEYRGIPGAGTSDGLTSVWPDRRRLQSASPWMCGGPKHATETN